MLACAVVMCGCGDADRGGPPAARTGTTGLPGPGERPDDEGIARAIEAVRTYQEAGRTAEAEAILEILVARAPHVAIARGMRAEMLLGRAVEAERLLGAAGADVVAGLRREALAELEAAIAVEPDMPERYHAAAVVEILLGRPDAALERLRAGVRRFERDVPVLLMAAQVALTAGHAGESEDYAGRALAVRPDEPYALATLAVARLELGDHDGAVAAVDAAVALAPLELALRVQQARVVRRAGNPRRAATGLLALPVEARRDAGVALELAAALLLLDEPARAAEAARLGLAGGAAGRADELRRTIEEAERRLAATGSAPSGTVLHEDPDRAIPR
ncbi:MAG: hypothetical protein KF817_01325 [Phycisphaeraceae bacterium]|nr:hypothetical protein [Phycisphaeraceae bacterium]